jgi:hypothetical protein
MVGLSKADTEAIVSGCRVPALLVMGSRDPDFPDATAEASAPRALSVSRAALPPAWCRSSA